MVCIVSRRLCVRCLVIVALSLVRDWDCLMNAPVTLIGIVSFCMFNVTETFQHQISICIVYIVPGI
ncbi:unnamed protein product [Brassica oleracea]|uniref:Uncharacterized protein n=1 Tax=Brassica oleracea TaxID=3712 RepID=A0A3P6FE18_BRAOL|nr:unnamed protein product [Brassica oleracea]